MKYQISNHCDQRMYERDISEKQLQIVLEKGKRKRIRGCTYIKYNRLTLLISSDTDEIITTYKKKRD